LAEKQDAIVLCTGFSEELNGESAADLGIAEFLHKPVTPKKMAAMVREVLDRCKAKR